MTEAPPQPAPPYRLAPCVALLGAIAGKSAPLATRRKIGLFMEQALSADRHGGEHRGVSAFFQHRSAWQYVVEEVQLERRLNNRAVLEWAKARARNGGHLGVRPMTEEEIAADLDAIEASLRPRKPSREVQYDIIEAALAGGEMTAVELCAATKIGIKSVHKRLKEMSRSRRLVWTRKKRDGQQGSKCMNWRRAA
jgi:hypothetical protein